MYSVFRNDLMGKRGPQATKGAPTTIRLEPALRAKLEAAAVASERSLSEEIATRLALSFNNEEGMDPEFGDDETYALCRLIASTFFTVQMEARHPWHEHAWTFEQSCAGIAELLRFFRPLGEPEVPDDALTLTNLRELFHAPDEEIAKAKENISPSSVRKVRCAPFSHAHRWRIHRRCLPRSSSDRLERVAALLKAHLIAAGTAYEALGDLAAEPARDILKGVRYK